MGKTKIKICGLRTLDNIRAVNEAEPDYVGFVFAESRRKISDITAGDLRRELAPGIIPVGVFVNEDIERIAGLCRNRIIDMIQLHGDEDENYISRLRRLVPNPVIRAVRVRSTEEILQYEAMGSNYLLLDAYREKEYGGSGVRFDWSLIPGLKKPFFLAGGINAENAAEAVDRYHPYGIDVSSGVEIGGSIDPGKVRELVHIIRTIKTV